MSGIELAFVLALAAAPTPATANAAPKPGAAGLQYTPWLTLRYDYGGIGIHRYGAGYHWGELGVTDSIAWWSVGPELLVSSRSERALQALEGVVRARAGVLGITGFGGSAEASVSTATDFERVVPTLSAGVLLNLAYVEAGVLAQLPLAERPEWMPALWLAVRFHIPLALPMQL